MCYCDTHFFTIDRADKIMVGRRPPYNLDEMGVFDLIPDPDLYYVIDPESLIQVIEQVMMMDWLDVERDGEFVYVKVPEVVRGG